MADKVAVLHLERPDVLELGRVTLDGLARPEDPERPHRGLLLGVERDPHHRHALLDLHGEDGTAPVELELEGVDNLERILADLHRHRKSDLTARRPGMIYTMGHSTLPAEDFVKAAKTRNITTVLDIRSHPTSKWDWFWKEKMESWLPEAGLRYEWWPELGGWTKRHLEFRERFGPRGVDLDAYAKGKFPKQRIATERQLKYQSKDIDPACPLHGCSSRKGSESPMGTSSGPATRRSGQSPEDDDSLRRQCDQPGGSNLSSLRSTRKKGRSASERQLVLPDTSPGLESGGAQQHPPACCTEPLVQSGISCTHAGPTGQRGETSPAEEPVCTCDIVVSPHWYNTGLYDYQFFLEIPEGVNGLKNLIERGRREDVVIVCSECQWWRCHRSMVSDALASAGVDSYHVMPYFRQKNKVKYAAGTKSTSHFKVLGNRLERYEPDVVEAWSALRAIS